IVREATVVLASHGETQIVDLVLPAIATLRVEARRSGGAPFAGAAVYVQDAVRQYLRFAGNTDVDGLVFTSVPEGSFLVEVRDPNTNVVLATATGSIAAADDEQTVTVGIGIPFAGDVQGTVFDG